MIIVTPPKTHEELLEFALDGLLLAREDPDSPQKDLRIELWEQLICEIEDCRLIKLSDAFLQLVE